MTNREKNKKRFDELGLGGSSDFIIAHRIAVRENGDVGLCIQTPCVDCIFCNGYWNCNKEKIKWLESEATTDELASEKKNEKKDSAPKHKLFISCPTKGRTEEDIKNSFEVLKRTAEAYTGKSLQVLNPYEPKTFKSDADRIRSISDSIRFMAEADYFITFENYFDYRGCYVENQVAALYGLKRVLAMTKFAAPDVLDKRNEESEDEDSDTWKKKQNENADERKRRTGNP